MLMYVMYVLPFLCPVCSRTLFVGRLAKSVTEATLNEEFSRFGPVESVEVSTAAAQQCPYWCSSTSPHLCPCDHLFPLDFFGRKGRNPGLARLSRLVSPSMQLWADKLMMLGLSGVVACVAGVMSVGVVCLAPWCAAGWLVGGQISPSWSTHFHVRECNFYYSTAR